MDFYKRRRLIASKMKPLSLYEAGWSNFVNCSIKDSQVYSFKSDYLQIGSGSSSEAAFGRLHFTDIVNLNKYKKLFITYYAPGASKTIKIGNLSSNLFFYISAIRKLGLWRRRNHYFRHKFFLECSAIVFVGKNIYYFEHIQDLVGGMTNGI